MAQVLVKENSKKLLNAHKIDFVSYSARSEGLVKTFITTSFQESIPI